MKRLFSRLSRKSIISGVLALGIIGAALTAAAWYPERPTFTMAQPADHVTFNSITDNPREGDERAFFEIKDAANTASDSFAHQTTVKDGQELLLRIYVHNNAADNLNGANLDGKGVAHDTKVRVWLPSVTDTVLRANAYVSAREATPQVVSDTVDMVAPTTANKFSISYVPGSAVAYNNFAGTAGLKLSDSIVTDGALIGMSQADGVVPGCFKYANVVVLKVKVKMENPGFTMSKKVAIPGSGTWDETVKATPGATVAYQLEFKNNGNTTLNNVVVRDQLPANVAIVPGSVKLFNGSNPSGLALSDAVVANGGQIIGDYAPGSNAYVQFKATMPQLDKLTCGSNKLTNIGQAMNGGYDYTDTADVTIDKTCENPTPVYSCDDLTLTPNYSTRTVSAVVKYTAKDGATYKNTTLVWGDSKQDVITGTTGTHTYAADGTYTVKANVLFTVNGVDKTPAVNPACSKTVTFSTTTKTPSVKIEKWVEGKKAIEVEVGKNYTYTVKVTNDGEVDLTNVLVSDEPEAGITLVSASLGTINGNTWSYVIPSLKVGESKSFSLTAKVTQYVEGTLTNTACVNAPEVNPSEPNKKDGCDDADVTVKKPDVPAPVYSCDALTLTVGANRSVTAKVDYTAKNGANLKMITYNWGDGTTPFATNNTTATHTYGNDGTFSVSLKLLFSANGSDSYAQTNANCVKSVTFTTPTTPPTTPETPQVLPDTGAGSVIGLFGLVSVLSAVGYRLFMSRKLARES